MPVTASIPDLEDRFLEPKAWRWHSYKNRNGNTVRFGSVYPDSRIPSAVIVILPGRSEFIEKYFELSRELAAHNMATWILDWHGQGKSQRYTGALAERGHSQDFQIHVEDLHDFILGYVKHACVHPDVGRIPMVMLGHSMGANIGLRFLHKYSGMFECAAFTAPMMGLKALAHMPVKRAVVLASILNMLRSKSYAFGQHAWHARQDHDLKVPLSFDEQRNKVHQAWMAADEKLRVGGVTFGWVYQAIKSCAFLSDENILKSIKTPCLVGVAGHEDLVENAAIHRTAKLLPHARLMEFPESGHEILMEKDAVRSVFLEALYTMIKEKIIDRPETLKPF